MEKIIIYTVNVKVSLSGDICLGSYMSYFDAWTAMCEMIDEYISTNIAVDKDDNDDSSFFEYEGKDQEGKVFGWRNTAHSMWSYKDREYGIREGVLNTSSSYKIL